MFQVLCNICYHALEIYPISQSSCSGCPFPRRANKTIAIMIATPAAAPNATVPASAMK